MNVKPIHETSSSLRFLILTSSSGLLLGLVYYINILIFPSLMFLLSKKTLEANDAVKCIHGGSSRSSQTHYKPSPSPIDFLFVRIFERKAEPFTNTTERHLHFLIVH